MRARQALSILSALADGIDPNSGEVFDDASPYNQPNVIRALNLAVTLVERELERDGPRFDPNAALHRNRGELWTRAEDAELTAAFRAGESTNRMALLHGRTPSAIYARLTHLGLVASGGSSGRAPGSSTASA